MQKSILLLVILIFSSTAFSQKFQQLDELYYELPDSVDLKNPDFFNQDNKIYTPGKEFIFSYRIYKNGDSLRVRVHQSGDTKTKNWTFVKQGQTDSLIIGYLGIQVKKGYGGLDQLFPDYSQTVIEQN